MLRSDKLSIVLNSERETKVFICYRRTDGSWHAEWLHNSLIGREFCDARGEAHRITTYYDKLAPGLADWQEFHFPSLQSSQALILVSTCGVAKDFTRLRNPDWVYEELRWWCKNRNVAPIVIDATGEGDRWLPELVKRKWPKINRIELRREVAETAIEKNDENFRKRICERIIGAIKESDQATVFEDVQRKNTLVRHLTTIATASVVFVIMLAIAIWIMTSNLPFLEGYSYRMAQLGYVSEPDMVEVPSGCYLMGSDDSKNTRPKHEVCFDNDFFISQFEVTFEDYDLFVRANGYERGHPDAMKGYRGNRPVINVSWEDAKAYIDWLNATSDPEQPYRLPSEAEWEYAARGGTESRYWWGDNVGENFANCDGCGSEWDAQHTAPVGSFPPNQYGVYDTAGNVWEWVQDCWHHNYENAPTDGSARTEQNEGDCNSHTVRGGAWQNLHSHVVSHSRLENENLHTSRLTGFRLAQDAE